jgi:hypothetical protein
MFPPTLEKEARLQPLISRISVEDAEAAATARVNALGGHPFQLRIQPLDQRPAVPTQVKIRAQEFRDMLAAGNNRIIKAVVGGEVAGVAVWNLVSNKKVLIEDGVTVLPPRKRTEEDEEALKGVDVEIRQQKIKTSANLRNEIMGDSKYWCVLLCYGECCADRDACELGILPCWRSIPYISTRASVKRFCSGGWIRLPPSRWTSIWKQAMPANDCTRRMGLSSSDGIFWQMRRL